MSSDSEQTYDAATEEVQGRDRRRRGLIHTQALALVIAWCPEAPHRVGQVLLLRAGEGRPYIFGRGHGDKDGFERLNPVRQVPGQNLLQPPIRLRRLSRVQLRFTEVGKGLFSVENLGRCALLQSGQRVSQLRISQGTILELDGQMLLYAVQRPQCLAPEPALADVQLPALGEPCKRFLVGESPSLWKLRGLIEFICKRSGHVLIQGPSGSGKELIAQAIHRGSDRASGPWVARNAATIPDGLMAAELFGHVRDYPSSGMADRPGLVGQAVGGTLFLDEIAELPQAMQANLLRLMDSGEYQRLGEGQGRLADIRLLGATNRPRQALKADVWARFRHVVIAPGLDERREDIPLLVNHLLLCAAEEDSELGERFVHRAEGQAPYVRVDSQLIEALLRHALPLQVRQLDNLLWQAMGQSTTSTVVFFPELLDSVAEDVHDSTALLPSVERLPLPGAEAIRESLIKNNYIQNRVWRELGLSNRYVLRRLIQKYNLPTGPKEVES